jgi:hypothetical protein
MSSPRKMKKTKMKEERKREEDFDVPGQFWRFALP